jgi:hypothetical protein
LEWILLLKLFFNPLLFLLSRRLQVLGRNCRFLQGPGTDPRAVEVIRMGQWF